jgi:hypothetical protein
VFLAEQCFYFPDHTQRCRFVYARRFGDVRRRRGGDAFQGTVIEEQ